MGVSGETPKLRNARSKYVKVKMGESPGADKVWSSFVGKYSIPKVGEEV